MIGCFEIGFSRGGLYGDMGDGVLAGDGRAWFGCLVWSRRVGIPYHTLSCIVLSCEDSFELELHNCIICRSVVSLALVMGDGK